MMSPGKLSKLSNVEEHMKTNIDTESHNQAYIFPLESIAKLSGSEIRENINKFITIIAILTKSGPLSYCAKDGNLRNCSCIADFIPGIATLIAKKSSVDDDFKKTFHQENKNSHTGDFKIENEDVRLFWKGGISDIIRHFSKKIYPKYKDAIDEAMIQFVFRYANDTVEKKLDNNSKSYTPEQFRPLVERSLGNKISLYNGAIPADFDSDTDCNDEERKDPPRHPRNCIWAGAPGTGKSFQLSQDASIDFITGNIMRVTFHPEYTYYDFVGTYRPKMSKTKPGDIEYAFVPGPFAKMLKKALWNANNHYCLIIEEINRANMAAVFGDVFQLLDRLENGESEYAICPSEELYEYLMEKQEGGKPMKGQQPKEDIRNELRLPGNLYLWATMNSADQGVFPMDTAFKRRWSFKNMDIDPSQESIDDWDKIRRGINDMLLTHHVQEDKLMGYYFLKDRERADLATALKEKVMLYLFEDAAKPFRKNVFKASMNTCAKLRQGLDRNAPDLGVFQSEVWDGNPKSKDELPNTGVSIAGEQANEAQS